MVLCAFDTYALLLSQTYVLIKELLSGVCWVVVPYCIEHPLLDVYRCMYVAAFCPLSATFLLCTCAVLSLSILQLLSVGVH